jgi:hypothetical protein
LRAYEESEIATAAANNDLPPRATPIPSIELARKGELQPPETKVREFKLFVDGRRRVSEQGYVKATRRHDGRWDAWFSGGSHNGGETVICDLVDYVDVVT